MVRWDTGLSETGNQARVIKYVGGISSAVLYPNKDVALGVFEDDKLDVDVITYEDYTGYAIHYGGEQYPGYVRGINVLSVDEISYPSVLSATNVTSTSFTANWYKLSSYTYNIDVSTNLTFSNILVGYNNLAITNGNTFKVVTGLTPDTDYYYRVRSKSYWNEYSRNSNFIKVTTLP